jgi:hypothetical protein
MDTSDSLPVALGYGRFPCALATRSSSPKPPRYMGNRVGLLSDVIRSLADQPQRKGSLVVPESMTIALSSD